MKSKACTLNERCVSHDIVYIFNIFANFVQEVKNSN